MSSVKRDVFARIALRFLLTLFVFSMLATGNAMATGATPTSPCDPLYMDAIEARAYLEAQREISQNQNLIFKPDSVLQYTCFDKFVGAVGSDDWQPFSDESVRWGPVPGQFPGALLVSLNALVQATVIPYIAGNFTGNYLSGRDEDTPRTVGVATAGAYDCTEMLSVWNSARCQNFMSSEDTTKRDGFYDFAWYASKDPRQTVGLSLKCDSPDLIGADGGAEDTAFNDNDQNYELTTENDWPATSGTYYTTDPVVTHFDLIMPDKTVVGDGGTGTTTIDCTKVSPIPTGVCVVRAAWSQVYRDAICPNPGCHYKAVGNTAASTPSASDCDGKDTDAAYLGTCESSSTATPGP